MEGHGFESRWIHNFRRISQFLICKQADVTRSGSDMKYFGIFSDDLAFSIAEVKPP